VAYFPLINWRGSIQGH